MPFTTPGDLPNPGIKPSSPGSPALQADSLPLSYLGSPVSGIQQSNSDIHIHISILFHILFPFRLLHDIEQSAPVCSTVGLAATLPPRKNHRPRGKRVGVLGWCFFAEATPIN